MVTVSWWSGFILFLVSDHIWYSFSIFSSATYMWNENDNKVAATELGLIMNKPERNPRIRDGKHCDFFS